MKILNINSLHNVKNVHEQKNNKNINFKGFYNNKMLLKTLEFANDNGMLFSTVVSFFLSAFVRPAAVLMTPNIDKENKQYACTKSISASFVKLGVTTVICAPMAAALGYIEKNPQKFLSEKTIKFLSNNAENIAKSSRYNFASKLLNLGTGFLVIVPQIMMTTALIEPLTNALFKKDKNRQSIKSDKTKKINMVSFGKNLSPQVLYKIFTEKLAVKTAKIMEFQPLQKFTDKYHKTNLAQHMFSLKDVLTASLFAKLISKNKEIKEDKKKTLIYNVFVTTAFSVSMAYLMNYLLKKPSEIFIENLKKANQNSPKIEKYIEGFKTAKPAILLGLLYYVLGSFVATKLAEILSQKTHVKKIVPLHFNNRIKLPKIFTDFQNQI